MMVLERARERETHTQSHPNFACCTCNTATNCDRMWELAWQIAPLCWRFLSRHLQDKFQLVCWVACRTQFFQPPRMPRKQRSRREKQLEHEQVLPLLRSIGRPGSGKRRLTYAEHVHFVYSLCCWLCPDKAFWLFISTSLSHLSSGWTSATRDRQKTQKILEVLQKWCAGLWQNFANSGHEPRNGAWTGDHLSLW